MENKLERCLDSIDPTESFMGSYMEAQEAQKIRNFKSLNRIAIKGAILFTGSSLMEQFPVCEMALSAGIGRTIYNRGIGGSTTDEFLAEIDTVLIDLQRAKVFINIGTNDIASSIYGDSWMERLMSNYDKIIRTALEQIPGVEIYMMAYYPANLHLPHQDEIMRSRIKDRTPENLQECNRRIAAIAEKYGQHYIDVNEGLADEDGDQRRSFPLMISICTPMPMRLYSAI